MGSGLGIKCIFFSYFLYLLNYGFGSHTYEVRAGFKGGIWSAGSEKVY
jgi:hypothetical protein